MFAQCQVCLPLSWARVTCSHAARQHLFWPHSPSSHRGALGVQPCGRHARGEGSSLPAFQETRAAVLREPQGRPLAGRPSLEAEAFEALHSRSHKPHDNTREATPLLLLCTD